MHEQADIAIVGTGAAGLAAAIFAAEAGQGHQAPRIVLLDGAKKIGAKILVSGGGRCNVTHERVTPRDFQGTSHLVKHVLAAFGAEATIKWFASLGVDLKREDTGKLFPVSDRAETVLRALLDRCRTLGVEIRPDHRVMSVATNPAGGSPPEFVVRHEQGECAARRLVLATGGRSLPRTGSDGLGWTMVQALGHTVTPTYPALVPLVLTPSMFHAELAGVSQEVELTTTVKGRQVDQRTGSLLWTHVGISGPVVMDASRFWTIATGEGAPVAMRCRFLPDMGVDTVDRWVRDGVAEAPRRTIAKHLAARVPDRFATALCRFVRVEPSTALGQLTREQRRVLVEGLCRFVLPIERDRGWNHAEVTAGGVPLNEINFRTMESRKVQGLYLIGELLDCDGRIGGFNFQWAWSTGHLAGRSAANSLGL
jgi:predicted Rossmann fold flavoprotein